MTCIGGKCVGGTFVGGDHSEQRGKRGSVNIRFCFDPFSLACAHSGVWPPCVETIAESAVGAGSRVCCEFIGASATGRREGHSFCLKLQTLSENLEN